MLSFLMRFKQICNHPSQWLGDGAWSEEDSGKWARLRDIAEVICRQAGEGARLHSVSGGDRSFGGVSSVRFRAAGLVLHGETEVKKRKDLVRRFQEDEAVGFFVLSLKAGRCGPQPHRRIARGALRPLVEPRGGKSGHRPRISHWTEQERAGT